MKLVVLGLSLSSSWGNGHATTYRALLKAFAARGHEVLFLERDVPWYAASRDLASPGWCELAFYEDVASLQRFAERIRSADAVMVGSYVPDGIAAGAMVQATAQGVTAFYDIDTPVTLARLARGDCAYLAPEQIPAYDVYLSFTGGPTLARLEREYGSPAARALYCSVDETVYRPVAATPRWDLGYLGTYSDDRQPPLDRLLLEAARRLPERRFVVAGPKYPPDIRWPSNVLRLEHVAPDEHPAFYAACRFTLNVTRADMIRAGWSPSVRLFEAAACGTPIISDAWDGLDELFDPRREIAIVQYTDEVVNLLDHTDHATRSAWADAGRRRVLAAHTAAHRAIELERHLTTHVHASLH